MIDARGRTELDRAAAELDELTEVIAVPGDVSSDWHRHGLIAAAGDRIDALVNNASVLGPSPQPRLAEYPEAELERVYRVNVLAPLALIRVALPQMAPGAAIVNVSSDAAVEAYPGWGGYGSSKAALEQLTSVLAAEHPELRIYSADPGEMRTRMHQQAYPGEDISDRPDPRESAPALVELIRGGHASGRYRAAELAGARA